MSKLVKKKRLWFGLLALVFVAALARAQRVPAANTVEKSIDVAGQNRTYLLHVPPDLARDKPAPLIFVFHGGGGAGLGAERLTRFSQIADREGAIVAYPDAIGRHWNDGREASFQSQREHVDDVAFVAAMIDAIAREHPIDPKRVFATGISNGAIFSHYLAANLSTRVAAIAPVVGGIAEPFQKNFKPQEPVAVFILQGTLDQMVPYHGGGVDRGRRGRVLDTERAVELWVAADGCAKEAQTGELPDADPDDGCRVKWSKWSNGQRGTEVVLYMIEGGGHTWPRGPQYLSERAIGKVCRDFDASEAIWEFFKKHPKP